jgi:hypothetical protein
LLHVADQAMYAAKTTGENQIAFVSLLEEADLRFLRAVEQRQFGFWLTGLGVEKLSLLRSGVRRLTPRFEAPGRLAWRLGWLTTTQRRSILHEQRAAGRRFKEIALERGLLTSDQLSILLALQLEPPEPLAASLVHQGVVSELAMRENLCNYYQWLQTPLDILKRH